MISITLTFSLEEAKQFFLSAGLNVAIQEMQCLIETWHNDAYYQNLDVWAVINPHTNLPERLDEAFVRCASKNKDRLISDISKVEIFNSFK